MSFACTRMSSVCHLYLLVYHPYVTPMYSYVIRMLLVCGFTMNHTFYISTYSLENIYGNRWAVLLQNVTLAVLLQYLEIFLSIPPSNTFRYALLPLHPDLYSKFFCFLGYFPSPQFLFTIPDKIFGTRWRNPVKLDRKRRVWYLILRVFLTAIAKV